MIRLFEVKLRIGQSEEDLDNAVYKKLGFMGNQASSPIDHIKISSKSIDARDKKNIFVSYNMDMALKQDAPDGEQAFVSKMQKKNRKIKIKVLNDTNYASTLNHDPVPTFRPVIIGFGPAGMFAALYFISNGIKPMIIERGRAVEDRVQDVEKFWREGVFDPASNPLFGEGGAGTFSDGKLTTGKNDPRISYILHEFYKAGAPEEILYMKNPHIGTDVLRKVVRNIRKAIIDGGGTVRFGTKLTKINVSQAELESIEVIDEDTSWTETIETDDLILAIGHSARDTYKSLFESGFAMEPKPFSIGLRIEHDQALIDRSQYGENFEKIYGLTLSEAEMPPAEYKLSYKSSNGRGVYTFCMCPGGEVITTAAEEAAISVNGMSMQKRDGRKANSALLVDVRTDDYGTDDPLSGIEFQRKFERKAFISGGSGYRPPCETVGDFMKKNSKLAECLPKFAVDGIREALPFFGKRIKGFDDPNAVLKGIESGSSSPVRILRNKELESSYKGVYPCGEGAGYAGGITSSAIDGLKCAEAIVVKYSKK